MAAVDAARNGRFSDADIDAPAAESPARPTMGPTDHLSPDQFAENYITNDEPPAARRPHYIGARTLHDWRTSPASSPAGTKTKTTKGAS